MAADTTQQIPSIGRIVHFVLADGQNSGQHRPAIVLRCWGDTPGASVNLLVFLDGENDGALDGNSVVWVTSVTPAPAESNTVRSYHFPEYVPAVRS